MGSATKDTISVECRYLIANLLHFPVVRAAEALRLHALMQLYSP